MSKVEDCELVMEGHVAGGERSRAGMGLAGRCPFALAHFLGGVGIVPSFNYFSIVQEYFLCYSTKYKTRLG